MSCHITGVEGAVELAPEWHEPHGRADIRQNESSEGLCRVSEQCDGQSSTPREPCYDDNVFRDLLKCCGA